VLKFSKYIRWGWSRGDGRVFNILVDSANAWSGGLANLDVTTLSPWFAPWVSDEVVSSSGGISAISDGDDGVVEVGAALCSAGQDAWGVGLEVGGVSLDGNRLGLLGDGSLDGISGSANNGVAYNSTNSLGWVIGAWASLLSGARGVGIIGFGLNRLVLGVFPGIAVQTTVAAEVALEGWAGDVILFGQLVEGAMEDGVCAFLSSNSGEGPAWTALALVLDGVDLASGDPVNWGWDANTVPFEAGNISIMFWAGHILKAEQFGLLLSSPVGDEVVAVDGRSLSLVVEFDLRVELVEKSGSEIELLKGGVRLSVLGDVLNEVKVGLR